MPVIFLSYRRFDSQDVTGRIYDRLIARYTPRQVFKDVDSIPMGVSFPAHLKQVLGKAAVVLVIIGPRWLHAQDEQGRRRLDDPNDYVRLEIEIALRSAMPVIPVLVSNAPMPMASELPPSLQPLVLRNGTSVRPDPDFHNDMERLLSELDRLEKLIKAQPGKSPAVNSPSGQSAARLAAAAAPVEPAPVSAPASGKGSAPVARAKKRATARPAPAKESPQSRKWSVLLPTALALLITGGVGLWASGLLHLKMPEGILPTQQTPGEAHDGLLPPRATAGGVSTDGYDLTGGYRFVSFAPGGPRVVLTFNDEKQKEYFARVYDLATGKTLSPPLKHDGKVRDAVFSPDGKRVVTLFGNFGYSTFPEAARVWNADTGEALTPPLKQSYSLDHAAFSPDGKKLVTTGEFEARVWDAATGKEIAPPLKGLAMFTGDSSFSPDGKRIVTPNNTSVKAVRVWDAATGKEVAPPLKHEDFIYHAMFSPDGKQIVTASGKAARLWDAATGMEVGPALKHKDFVWWAAFSPNGKRVVTASKDRTARIWDAVTGQPTTPPLQHEDQVEKANFSLDGKRLVTSSQDKIARLWDATTGKEVAPALKHEDRVRRAAFSPDGKQVVTVTYSDTIRLWDARTGQELKKLTKPAP